MTYTYNDLFRIFKANEGEQATYTKLINAYRKYIGEHWGWYYTLEDVTEDIKHDYLTNVEAKDGTILLHYLDECHELVVLPDRVLDDEDDILEYEKYIR